SSRRRHTRWPRDWSSDVCSSDLMQAGSSGLRKAVLIAVPTASGKSALALDLAQKFGGVVINADSMQVYRDLRIITARPSVEDEEIGRASCREGVWGRGWAGGG